RRDQQAERERSDTEKTSHGWITPPGTTWFQLRVYVSESGSTGRFRRTRGPSPRVLMAAPPSRRLYSTVTVLARFRGWSTLRPRRRAIRYASSCSGTTASAACRKAGVRGT
ncbi:MAG: hypothetical protein QOE95_1260, partial [Gaiellaceae bacterium]|nr:hypothetical protein [Gaiellaceae bacterium]